MLARWRRVSDPCRSRKQPREPIRIFIVLQRYGLVRENSFDCEEVEARIEIVSSNEFTWLGRGRNSGSSALSVTNPILQIGFGKWMLKSLSSKRSSSTTKVRLCELWIANDDEEIEGHRRTKTLPLDFRGNPRRWVLLSLIAYMKVTSRSHRTEKSTHFHLPRGSALASCSARRTARRADARTTRRRRPSYW